LPGLPIISSPSSSIALGSQDRRTSGNGQLQNRVFFDRYLFSKVVTLLGPTLKLILSALAFAKQLIPGVRRTLVIPSINFEKGVDEFVGT
jgi:hypothetical protein